MPKPTIRPATARSSIEGDLRQRAAKRGVEEWGEEEAGDESQAPADLIAGRMNEAAEDAADTRDAAIQEEEQSRGGADQQAAEQR